MTGTLHEWALAEAIVFAIEEEARKRNSKVIEVVEIVLGELQNIDEEIFEFALNELVSTLREHGIDIHKLSIVREDAVFKCLRCGYTWRLRDTDLSDDVREAIHFVPDVARVYIRCPNCGSHDFEIIAGRGVYIKRLVFG